MNYMLIAFLLIFDFGGPVQIGPFASKDACERAYYQLVQDMARVKVAKGYSCIAVEK